MYKKLVIYISKIAEIQSKINDLETVRGQLESWISSDDYPEFLMIKFSFLLSQIDGILNLLNLMLSAEKANYPFNNDFFVEISLIPFNLNYPYPVSFLVDLFEIIVCYSYNDEDDHYSEDEEGFFYELLKIFSQYISSVDDTSSGSGDNELIDCFYSYIDYINDCCEEIPQEQEVSKSKKKPKP